jgi:hypothetical protein
LKYADRHRHIPQPPRPQIHKIDSTQQNRRRICQQDLTTMTCCHHPRRTVEHRTEVITIPPLGFTGRQSHPHRQRQRSLCGYRGIDGGPRRGERRTPRHRCA